MILGSYKAIGNPFTLTVERKGDEEWFDGVCHIGGINEKQLIQRELIVYCRQLRISQGSLHNIL